MGGLGCMALVDFFLGLVSKQSLRSLLGNGLVNSVMICFCSWEVLFVFVQFCVSGGGEHF